MFKFGFLKGISTVRDVYQRVMVRYDRDNEVLLYRDIDGCFGWCNVGESASSNRVQLLKVKRSL